jgi:predicted aminopeptidase
MSRPPLWFLALLVWLVVGQTGCFEVRYLARQGVDLLKLMRARREVSDVIADPETPHAVKQRLRLAMQARQFGIDVLGLNGGADFTRYVDTHGHLGYNLTVAEQTRLRLKSWGGGRIPYLGFLSRDTALATQAEFERQGYDTALRGIDAFSGLGIIISPIYSDTIATPGPGGDLRTVENVLHEMAHCTVTFFTDTELNEPFATVVGNYGAAMFFRMRARDSLGPVLQKTTKLASASAGNARTDNALSTWLRGALRMLSAFYRKAAADHLTKAEILGQREIVFQQLQQSYRVAFPGPHYKILADGPLNNAELLSLGIYLAPGAEKEEKKEPKPPRGAGGGANLQLDLLAAVGGDVRAYIALYRRAHDGNDALTFLKMIAKDYRQEMGLDKKGM